MIFKLVAKRRRNSKKKVDAFLCAVSLTKSFRRRSLELVCDKGLLSIANSVVVGRMLATRLQDKNDRGQLFGDDVVGHLLR